MKALATLDRFWGNSIITPEGDDSPFPRIEELRAKGNILRTYMVNGWFVVSHADVKHLLTDKRLSSQVFDNRLIQLVIRSAVKGQIAPLIDYPSMVNLDAPDHTRLRKLAAKSFTTRFVHALEPAINQQVTELLAKVDNTPRFEFMDTLAKPLPAIVIAEMLGVPPADRHLFEKWSSELLGYTEVLDSESIQRAVKGDLALRHYLQELISHKRTHPGDDLISAMIEAEELESKLEVNELLSTCTLLLVAGHETTTRLIGSCLSLLAQHPTQLEQIRKDRSLLNNAIEEALRLEPPVLAVSRMVSESFEYKGHKFKQGQVLLLSIAGANRDPDSVKSPASFDIHRRDKPLVSFGHGIHLCLGMPLARLEAKVALNNLLDRFDVIEIDESEVIWDDSPFFRGPKKLPVRVA